MHVRIQTMALGALFSLAILGMSAASAGAAPQTKAAKKTETTVVKKAKKAKPVIVKVAAGDTLEKIAKDHKTTYVRLFNANKSIVNPDMIDIGDKITIPNKSQKLPDRFGAIQPVVAATQPVTTSAGGYYQAAPVAAQNSGYATQQSYPTGSTAGNTYAYGNCTWYVKNRRSDLPNMLGNGGSWSASASRQGYATGSTPRAGAVAEQAGHVAYVEKVNGNGTVTISEMNYAGGYNQVSSRTVSAGSFSYIY